MRAARSKSRSFFGAQAPASIEGATFVFGPVAATVANRVNNRRHKQCQPKRRRIQQCARWCMLMSKEGGTGPTATQRALSPARFCKVQNKANTAGSVMWQAHKGTHQVLDTRLDKCGARTGHGALPFHDLLGPFPAQSTKPFPLSPTSISVLRLSACLPLPARMWFSCLRAFLPSCPFDYLSGSLSPGFLSVFLST